jgi:anti-sigma B factor antagonist
MDLHPNHFRVETRKHDRATVVLIVTGELDLASSPALDEELRRIGESDVEVVIVDLRKLEFIDSTGLIVLVKASQRVEEAGKRFALVKGGQQVERLLNLTGVGDRLRVVDTPEELLGGG